MTRRAQIVTAAGLALVAWTARTTPAYDKLVASATAFHNYLDGLKATGNSLSPIERFVFSLVLTNSKQPHTEKHGTAPERRT